MHSPIVNTSDFNNWWTLFHLFQGSFFSRFMIGIQRSISFYTINFYWIIEPCSFIVFSVWIIDIVVYRSSLTRNTHDLCLISWSFEVWVCILLKFWLLTSLIFQDFVLFEVWRRSAFIRIKFLFLVTPRSSSITFGIFMKPWFWFIIS